MVVHPKVEFDRVVTEYEYVGGVTPLKLFENGMLEVELLFDTEL